VVERLVPIELIALLDIRYVRAGQLLVRDFLRDLIGHRIEAYI
jgi:hypothetical protein